MNGCDFTGEKNRTPAKDFIDGGRAPGAGAPGVVPVAFSIEGQGSDVLRRNRSTMNRADTGKGVLNGIVMPFER